MQDAGYNGWSNYPTWAVNLWLSNDAGLYSAVGEIVEQYQREAAELAAPHTAPYPVPFLFDRIEGFARELVEMDEASLRSDLIGYALDQVDWREIANAWLEA